MAEGLQIVGGTFSALGDRDNVIDFQHGIALGDPAVSASVSVAGVDLEPQFIGYFTPFDAAERIPDLTVPIESPISIVQAPHQRDDLFRGENLRLPRIDFPVYLGTTKRHREEELRVGSLDRFSLTELFVEFQQLFLFQCSDGGGKFSELQCLDLTEISLKFHPVAVEFFDFGKDLFGLKLQLIDQIIGTAYGLVEVPIVVCVRLIEICRGEKGEATVELFQRTERQAVF